MPRREKLLKPGKGSKLWGKIVFRGKTVQKRGRGRGDQRVPTW